MKLPIVHDLSSGATEEPQASMVGLAIGCVVGIIMGIAMAAILNRAEPRQPGRVSIPVNKGFEAGPSITVFLIGVVVFTLPYRFSPLVAVTGGH